MRQCNSYSGLRGAPVGRQSSHDGCRRDAPAALPSGCFGQGIGRQLGFRVQQFDADDASILVLVKDHVGRHLRTFQHLLTGQADVGGIVVGPVFDRGHHVGRFALRSKNAVKIRTSSAVSKQAAGRMRSPCSGIGRKRRSAPICRGSASDHCGVPVGRTRAR